MAAVRVSIPDEAVAATRVALAHIMATELERLANDNWRSVDVEDYDDSENDRDEGVRDMCTVLRARAAALRLTIREVPNA
jgi:hypothetical protein